MMRRVERDEIRDVLRTLLEEETGLGYVPIAERYRDGKIVIKPRNPEQQPKEIPVETFFHKIVMVRDRLRVLEQKINSSKTLADAEKVELQQYVTKVYGSLTSFNVLFRDREDQFRGGTTS
jgi:hypothetical protein